MPAIQSSVIRWADYDAATRELRLTFTSSKTYAYQAVPETLYARFLKAASHGQFFNEHIRDEDAAVLIRCFAALARDPRSGPQCSTHINQSLR
jgi:hypothetical protein